MTTRIALAGDWHATTWWARDCVNSLPDDVKLLIHLGDFGLMGPTRADYITAVNECAASRDLDVWVIPGNHEDYDWLEQRPVDDDGVAQIAERVFVLPRGYRFVIERVVFCAVGGAVSIDQGQRTMGTTWWPQEEITEAEVMEVSSGGHADVLLTHDAPINADPPSMPHADLTQFAGVAVADKAYLHHRRVQDICDALTPRRLLHGHFHSRYTRPITSTGPGGDPYECVVDGLACDRLAGNLVLTTIDGGAETIEEFEVIHDH